jgi:hypothetical protein
MVGYVERDKSGVNCGYSHEEKERSERQRKR